MRKQRVLAGILTAAGMITLILDSKTATAGAQSGIILCLTTVIPSLFPFFVLSVLLTSSLQQGDMPILRSFGRFFSMPTGSESILVPAFLGGYPVGAQCIGQAYQKGELGKKQAERMLCFCNNAGPAFLFGITAKAFPEKWMCWALWGIQILCAWIVSCSVSLNDWNAAVTEDTPVSLPGALYTAITVMAKVCGWVILFRILQFFLTRWILWLFPVTVQIAICGFLEMTNGCCMLEVIQSIPLRFCLCSGILGFGGICVTMQTMSVIGDLDMRYYWWGKLLHTVLAVLFAWLVISSKYYLLPVAVVVFRFVLHKREKNSSFQRSFGV